MRKTTLALWQHFILFTWRKVTSARRVTRCRTTANPPLEVAQGQRRTHVNSYRRQTTHRSKVDPGVSELPRDHVNRPFIIFVSLTRPLERSSLGLKGPRDVNKIKLNEFKCILKEYD